MPIYTPSYFPPAQQNGSIVGATSGLNSQGARRFLAGLSAGNGGTVNDLIIIGNLAGDAGITDSNLAGSILIGNNAGSALRFSSSSDAVKQVLAIGTDAAQTMVNGSGVYIGQDAANAAVGDSNLPERNVVIGEGACENAAVSSALGGQFSTCVIIGHRAARRTVPTAASLLSSVIIGYQSLPLTSCSQCVYIGATVGPTATGSTNTVIGNAGATGLGTGSGNTIIGANSNIANDATDNIGVGRTLAVGGTGCNDNIVLTNNGGVSTLAIGADGNVLLGSPLGISLTGGASRNILIGHNAGQGEITANSDRLIVETFQTTGSVRRAILYADMAAGNLVVGRSAPGATRNFGNPGTTNALMILEGTVGASNPSGGGYFYYDAATGLHFVGAAGTNTVLAPP